MSTTTDLRGDAQLKEEKSRAAALHAPPEIKAEVLLEVMAGVAARISRLESEEPVLQRRADLTRLRKAVLARRFEFDPHDGVQVDAFLSEFVMLASTLNRA
jgi:hypothetical protein